MGEITRFCTCFEVQVIGSTNESDAGVRGEEDLQLWA